MEQKTTKKNNNNKSKKKVQAKKKFCSRTSNLFTISKQGLATPRPWCRGRVVAGFLEKITSWLADALVSRREAPMVNTSRRGAARHGTFATGTGRKQVPAGEDGAAMIFRNTTTSSVMRPRDAAACSPASSISPRRNLI